MMRANLRREETGTVPAAGTSTREQTGTMHAAQRSVHPPYPGEYSNVMRASVSREQTGTMRAAQGSNSPPYPREQTGATRAARPQSDPSVSGAPSAPLAMRRTGPLPPVPERLRNRLQYVALTAEVTGGECDARREDGLSRLCLLYTSP